VLLVSAAFVLSMVIWMNRHGIHVKPKLNWFAKRYLQRPRRMGRFSIRFLMIFREGVETVLLLAALRLNTSGILEALGAVLGIGLAVVFGVSFVRGTIRVNLKQFFRMTTVILMVVVAQLTITGLHELSESQILPQAAARWRSSAPSSRTTCSFSSPSWPSQRPWSFSNGAAARPESRWPEGRRLRKARWTARREKPG